MIFYTELKVSLLNPKILFFSLKGIFAPIGNALWPFFPLSIKLILLFIGFKTCEKSSIFWSQQS